MKPHKVILMGDINFYNKYRRCIEKEVLKGNIQVEAIVTDQIDKIESQYEIPIVVLSELQEIECDYLIDMNPDGVGSEICKTILYRLNKTKRDVVPIHTLMQPCFDFDRWVKVKESNVSIIASHCWGGFLYNTLGLEFLSPFINLFIGADDFVTLLGDLRRYMELPLEYVGTSIDANTNKSYPIGKLGDVKINFNHYDTFEDACACWERRKKRINYNNILVEISTDDVQIIEKFLALPYENKICFTILPYEHENVISLYGNPCMMRCNNEAWSYANKSAGKNIVEYKEYDMLKLLSHEKDFRRTC